MAHEEALTLALEALELIAFFKLQPDSIQSFVNHYTPRIKEALAQPEQEPVAWRVRWPKVGGGHAWVMNDAPLMAEHGFVNEPLYTTPPASLQNEAPQRKPLTGDALLSAAQSCLSPSQYDHFEALIENDQDAHNRLARAIENERVK